MTRRSLSQLEHTAYYEAGHVVVAHLLHQWCLYVTIVPDGETQGHCAFAQTPDSRSLWRPETPHSEPGACKNAASRWEEILTAYAGPAAGETFAGQADVQGSFLDRCEAEALIEEEYQMNPPTTSTPKPGNARRQIQKMSLQIKRLDAGTLHLQPEALTSQLRSMEQQLSRMEQEPGDISIPLRNVEKQLECMERKGAHLRRLWKHTTALVRMRPYRSAIAELAAELLQRRTLEREQALHVIRPILMGDVT